MILLVNGQEMRFGRRTASQVKPVVDMEGVQDVNLTDDGAEDDGAGADEE